MSSATSALLTNVNLFHPSNVNGPSQNIYKTVLAEIAYIAIIPFAIVEAAISQIVKVIAQCLPIDTQRYQTINSWATNSTESMKQAMLAAITNLFSHANQTSRSNLTSFISHVNRPRGSNLTGFNNATSAPPPALLQPPAVEPAVAAILSHYELADNAKRQSDIFNKLYENLPQPTPEELSQIGAQIAQLVSGSDPTNRIKTDLDSIARKTRRNTWEDRFIKMLISIQRELLVRNNSSDREIVKVAIIEAYEKCINRKSTEIERLFFYYASPALNSIFQQSLTPLEALTFEMMRCRMDLRDKLINTFCNDSHNAASHNYFRRKLNLSIFYLPPSLLSSEDLAYETFAMKNKEPLIIKTFQNVYHSPNTLYTHFIQSLYPKQGDNFKFKPNMFMDWLQSTGRSADCFEDEAFTRFKPQLIIDYLEMLGFLKKKTG